MEGNQDIATCPICMRTFKPHRRGHVYCCNSCRQSAHQQRKRETASGKAQAVRRLRMTAPDVVELKPATIENVTRSVYALRVAASELRHYSLRCEPALREICALVSDGVEDSLRRVGL